MNPDKSINQQFYNYLFGTLSIDDKTAFEATLKTDTNLQTNFDLYKSHLIDEYLFERNSLQQKEATEQLIASNTEFASEVQFRREIMKDFKSIAKLEAVNKTVAEIRAKLKEEPISKTSSPKNLVKSRRKYLLWIVVLALPLLVKLGIDQYQRKQRNSEKAEPKEEQSLQPVAEPTPATVEIDTLTPIATTTKADLEKKELPKKTTPISQTPKEKIKVDKPIETTETIAKNNETLDIKESDIEEYIEKEILQYEAVRSVETKRVTSLSTANTAFNNAKYQEAKDLYEAIGPVEQAGNKSIIIYAKGLCALYLDEMDYAIKALNKVIADPDIGIGFRQEAEWNLAIALIKTGDYGKAKVILQGIQVNANHDFSDKSKEVLEKYLN